MYVISIAVRGANNVDVFVFRRLTSEVIQKDYCITGVNPIVAYLYVCALSNMLQAQLHQNSLVAYRYIKNIYDADQRKN